MNDSSIEQIFNLLSFSICLYIFNLRRFFHSFSSGAILTLNYLHITYCIVLYQNMPYPKVLSLQTFINFQSYPPSKPRWRYVNLLHISYVSNFNIEYSTFIRYTDQFNHFALKSNFTSEPNKWMLERFFMILFDWKMHLMCLIWESLRKDASHYCKICWTMITTKTH